MMVDLTQADEAVLGLRGVFGEDGAEAVEILDLHFTQVTLAPSASEAGWKTRA